MERDELQLVAPHRHPSLHANQGMRVTKWWRFKHCAIGSADRFKPPTVEKELEFTSANGMTWRLVKR